MKRRKGESPEEADYIGDWEFHEKRDKEAEKACDPTTRAGVAKIIEPEEPKEALSK